MKKCKVCGKKLDHEVQTYCSIECARIGERVDRNAQSLTKQAQRKSIKKNPIETVAVFCKDRTCCHKGKLGNEPCCDYLYHTGQSRPKPISKCKGYRKRVFKRTPEGKTVTTYASIEDASKKTGIPMAKLKQYINKPKKLIDGFYYKQENFNENFFASDFTNE